MSVRSQDKLILLLESGTSPQVRRTAAQQLAELTHKLFRAHGPGVEAEEGDAKVALPDGEDVEVWTDALETITKILPLLHSRSSETRHASAHALGLIASLLPSSSSVALNLESTPLELRALFKSGQTLVASAGREFIAKPEAGDKAKRRKAMMGSLGLGDAVGWGDDVDDVIGEDEGMDTDEVKVEATKPKAPPKDPFEGLSARQITMLKRKKGNIVEEANK